MSPPAVPVQLPEDVSLCHELIRQLVAACGQSQQRIAQLEHQLEQLYKAHYGPRAEKIVLRRDASADRGGEEPSNRV